MILNLKTHEETMDVLRRYALHHDQIVYPVNYRFRKGMVKRGVKMLLLTDGVRGIMLEEIEYGNGSDPVVDLIPSGQSYQEVHFQILAILPNCSNVLHRKNWAAVPFDYKWNGAAAYSYS